MATQFQTALKHIMELTAGDHFWNLRGLGGLVTDEAEKDSRFSCIQSSRNVPSQITHAVDAGLV